MMDIIIIRSAADCIRKQIIDLPSDVEIQVRSDLHVLSCPSSWGTSDIRVGFQEKAACLKMQTLAEAYPRLKGLFQLVSLLEDEEEVVCVDAEKYSSYDVFCWRMALIEKKKGANPVEILHFYKLILPANLWPRYELLTFGNFGYDQYIGRWAKSERVCRFCGRNDNPEAKNSIFGDPKNSHAISFFLGNDSLFCLEECKECNERFGQTIEADLSNYYAYYRASEGRKSREKKPLTATGFNFEYRDNHISIYSDKPIENAPKVGEKIPEEGLLLHLDNEEPCNLHNIYKLLVKYVIACLPNEYLPSFKRTVKWINGELHPQKFRLPPVYRIETLDNVQSPTLNVYIRKDKIRDVPYCIGELRFLENLYVYAVPYCNDYDVFVGELHRPLAKFIEGRHQNIDFTIENFCDDEPKLITTHVKIEGTSDEVLQPLDPSCLTESEEWWRKRNHKMLKRFGTTDIHPDKKYM